MHSLEKMQKAIRTTSRFAHNPTILRGALLSGGDRAFPYVLQS